jgi:hypothetical protein
VCEWLDLCICPKWNVVEISDDFDGKKFECWSVTIYIHCNEIFDEFCTARTNVEVELIE